MQVHNVSFAFELMLDGGLQKPKARPEGKARPVPWGGGRQEGGQAPRWLRAPLRLDSERVAHRPAVLTRVPMPHGPTLPALGTRWAALMEPSVPGL